MWKKKSKKQKLSLNVVLKEMVAQTELWGEEVDPAEAGDVRLEAGGAEEQKNGVLQAEPFTWISCPTNGLCTILEKYLTAVLFYIVINPYFLSS